MTSAVDDRLLQAGYRQCAEITRRNGTTYYWGVQLLPRERRRHVHAVYALCRLADDIVDDQAATAGRSAAEIGSQLADFAADFRRAVTDGSADPVLAAVWYRRAADTGLDWGLYNLGNLLATGRGVVQDQYAAFALYREAAHLGHAKSMNLLGRYLEDGRYCPADPHGAAYKPKKGDTND